MKETKIASFAFKNFRVDKFSIDTTLIENHQMGIEINPSGLYNLSNGVFEINVKFNTHIEKQEDIKIIELEFVGIFKFEDDLLLDEIPSYFYLNGLAILFPYIRAFISNLTLQANIKPLILPVLNLTGLDVPLKENTKVVEN